jgi:methylthioribose-1-phosphate isomerase
MLNFGAERWVRSRTRAFFGVVRKMKTLDWNPKSKTLKMIDQRLLPGRLEVATYHEPGEVAQAIRSMVVRGAPAIGAAAAYGLALAALNSHVNDVQEMRTELHQAAEILLKSRPTAVNLSWAINRILKIVDHDDSTLNELRQKVVAEAEAIAREDVEINKQMARNGAALIDDGDTIIHHCNTGALATVDWGTALGVIRMAHEMGKKIRVLVDETRPRLQGARLTAWELDQYGVPYDIISDNAAGYFLHSGQVQKVFFGADRVAANGDVANKIGTYMLALAAYDNDVPAYSVVPTSTIDLNLKSGDEIPIEERSQDEVLGIQVHGQPAVPKGATARNPAFDVTPHHLVSAIVTEKGIIYPPYEDNLRKAVTGV